MKVPHDTIRFIGINPTGDLGGFTAYTSRRAGTVWFVKSPPLTPPTIRQLHQRDRFRLAAQAWRNLDHDTKQNWHLAARRARLYVNGYTLFVWYQLTRARAGLATIERQSAITLLSQT